MAAEANVISLKVRARRSAELSFPLAGVIERAGANSELGSVVPAFDPRTGLYPRLREVEVDSAGQPTGRLVHGSDRIRRELEPHALFVLNNEQQAAELDQAILERHNAYLAQYQHRDEIDRLVNQTSAAKILSLEQLKRLVDQHHQEIEAAYRKELAAVGSIENPAHDATIRPTTIATIKLGAVGTREFGKIEDWDGDGKPGHGIYYTHKIDQSVIPTERVGHKWEDHAPNPNDPRPQLVAQQITSIVQSDQITHPRIENEMRHTRLSIDVGDELLAEQITRNRVSNLRQIFDNELLAIDYAIRKLQLSYIETFLCAPIKGRITGVYKQAGESVRIGDPIIRIEDNELILVSGQLKCLTSITVGQKIKVTASHPFGSKSSSSLELGGRLMMVRGFEGDVGRWNVVFSVDDNAATTVPLGYEFDPTYTKIAVG